MKEFKKTEIFNKGMKCATGLILFFGAIFFIFGFLDFDGISDWMDWIQLGIFITIGFFGLWLIDKSSSF